MCPALEEMAKSMEEQVGVREVSVQELLATARDIGKRKALLQLACNEWEKDIAQKKDGVDKSLMVLERVRQEAKEADEEAERERKARKLQQLKDLSNSLNTSCGQMRVVMQIAPRVMNPGIVDRELREKRAKLKKLQRTAHNKRFLQQKLSKEHMAKCYELFVQSQTLSDVQWETYTQQRREEDAASQAQDRVLKLRRENEILKGRLVEKQTSGGGRSFIKRPRFY